MTAPADWLTDKRPPLPHRVYLPLYQEAVTASKQLLGDLEAREATAVLYEVGELQRLLDLTVPAMPAIVDEVTWPDHKPVEDGTVPEWPRVSRRSVWRWVGDNLNAKRLVAGGASGLVLAITALGSWLQ